MLPRPDVIEFEQEVGVLSCFGRKVEHRSGRDKSFWRDRCDVLAVSARHPVIRCVEMRSGVLAGAEVVPVPGGAALVVVAYFLELELCGLPELWRQLQGG